MAWERNTYKAGQWRAECDRCGFAYYSGQLRREWTGLMTCTGPGTADCWEERHPQDFVRARPDRQSVPWVSSPSFDVRVTETDPDDL